MSGDAEVEFEPWSRRSMIAGTSYAVQIGKVEGEWAVCIFRGREIISVKKTGTLDINVLTSIIYSSLATPPSHYAIMRSLSNIIMEAKVRQKPMSTSTEESSSQQVALTFPQQPKPSQSVEESAVKTAWQPEKAIEAREEVEKEVISESVQGFFKIPAEHKVKEMIAPTPMPPSEEVREDVEPRVEDIPFPEKWERTVSSLMLLWGIAVSFITEKAKRRADELWSYYRFLIKESWSKIKETSFKELMSLFISQCRLMGANVKVEKLTESDFEANIECLASKFKEKYKDILNLPPEFPCIICQMRGEEIGKLHGFKVEVTLKNNGCKINASAPPKEGPSIII